MKRWHWLGHNWSKWESYIQSGTTLYDGPFVSAEVRGKTFPFAEQRQKRTCETCGRVQDVLVAGS